MYLPWEIQLIINEIIDTSDSEPAYLNEHKGLNAVCTGVWILETVPFALLFQLQTTLIIVE